MGAALHPPAPCPYRCKSHTGGVVNGRWDDGAIFLRDMVYHEFPVKAVGDTVELEVLESVELAVRITLHLGLQYFLLSGDMFEKRPPL